MCGNCHNVNFDLDKDGKIEKGRDLVLQQTFDEYVVDYKSVGGSGTCISCHMPVVANLSRVVNTTDAPTREVHDHSFLGVDYSLDDPAQRDLTRAGRTALLKSSAKLDLRRDSLVADGTNVAFEVAITNDGTGHNLPSGFAFARQVWLEVRALDAGGRTVASSGLLPSPSSDLCETEVLSDTNNPLSKILEGCPNGADPALVHFQQKLVNAVEPARDAQGNVVRDQLGQPILRAAPAGREVLLQVLLGGVVARRRPFDGATLGTLRPYETRSFAYSLPTNGATVRRVSARLLFRNTAPYILRGLALEQTQDVPGLAQLADNLEVVEMAAVTVDVAN
jgi:hypothetical protein